jgi:hypothetical protein
VSAASSKGSSAAPSAKSGKSASSKALPAAPKVTKAKAPKAQLASGIHKAVPVVMKSSKAAAPPAKKAKAVVAPAVRAEPKSSPLKLGIVPVILREASKLAGTLKVPVDQLITNAGGIQHISQLELDGALRHLRNCSIPAKPPPKVQLTNMHSQPRVWLFRTPRYMLNVQTHHHTLSLIVFR